MSEGYNLFDGNFYDEVLPFECNLYDVLKRDKIDEAIMGIIMAIQDSYLYVARHSVGEAKMNEDDQKDLNGLFEVLRYPDINILRDGN